MEYPRTAEIRYKVNNDIGGTFYNNRISYVLQKIFAVFGIFAALYFMLEHVVYPILLKLPSLSLYETILQLLLPFMVIWLLLFFMIFECICNTFAEFTKFADRRFYDDWWNRYK